MVKNLSKGGKEKGALNKFSLKGKEYILTTIHRAENTDNYGNLKNIWEALIEIAKQGLKIFFPAHPRTKKALKKSNLIDGKIPDNLILNEPVSYTEMIILEKNAKLIITDSGGVQKESYFFKVPCIIPRGETEWVELVDAGWNKVVGNKKEDIVEEAIRAYSENINDKKWIDFYGGGKSSERIVEVVRIGGA